MASISVIVPIYYGQKYISGIIRQIEKCKKKLTDKDYVEIIFINDAPDDRIFQEWRSKTVNIIIINSHINNGIHGTRVKGIQFCRGEFILFLDQDDKIQPEYFWSQLCTIGDNDAVVCKAIHEGKEVYSGNDYFENIVSKEYVLRSWNLIVSPGQVLMRRDAIPKVWIENIMHYNGADDWLLWLCMMAERAKFSLNDNILYEHVMHGKNASDDIMSMLLSEQEVIHIIQREQILVEEDFRLLMEGFFLKNLNRTWGLYCEKLKLDVLDRWKIMRGEGIKYSEYLLQLNLRKVAIYGCGVLGRCLYEELKEDLIVGYFIDRNASAIQESIPVYTLQDILPEVDGVIITLINTTEDVKNMIEKAMGKKIFLLVDWVNESWDCYLEK